MLDLICEYLLSLDAIDVVAGRVAQFVLADIIYIFTIIEIAISEKKKSYRCPEKHRGSGTNWNAFFMMSLFPIGPCSKLGVLCQLVNYYMRTCTDTNHKGMKPSLFRPTFDVTMCIYV